VAAGGVEQAGADLAGRPLPLEVARGVEGPDDDRVSGVDGEHGTVVARVDVVRGLAGGVEAVGGHAAPSPTDRAAEAATAVAPPIAVARVGTTTGGVARSSSTTSAGAVRLR
jgi:hypothetical protein